MKTRNILIIAITFWITTGLLIQSKAQGTARDEIIKENRITEAFNGIEADQNFNIILEQAEETKVIVETQREFQDAVKASVINGTLLLSTNTTEHAKILNVYISSPEIREIKLSGDAHLNTKGTIHQKELNLKTYGTALISMDIEVDELNTESHGASEIILNGNTVNHVALLEGASKLISNKLNSETTTIETNGTSKAFVNTYKKLDITANANSSVEYENKPEKVNRHNNANRVYKEYSFNVDDRDNARLNLGNLDISYNESRDSTVVKLGRHWFIVDDYGNAHYRRMYRDKFNCNWAGILIGVNGYLTPDHDMDFPQEYSYLDLNLSKSLRFDINIFEQNIRFTKDNRFGMATGLGIEIRNYHFEKNVSLVPDEPQIKGYYNEGVYVTKSKLAATYINIPFLLEYQTNSYSNHNSFHIGAGMVFGIRAGSHTKIKFEEKNKEYSLIDPVSGEAVYTKVSPNKSRIKDFGSYHLNPFKAEAMFTIGWGWVNLYATYAVTTLFKKDQGPELYPFSIGISLLKW